MKQENANRTAIGRPAENTVEGATAVSGNAARPRSSTIPMSSSASSAISSAISTASTFADTSTLR